MQCSYLRAFCTSECRAKHIVVDKVGEKVFGQSAEHMTQSGKMNNVKLFGVQLWKRTSSLCQIYLPSTNFCGAELSGFCDWHALFCIDEHICFLDSRGWHIVRSHIVTVRISGIQYHVELDFFLVWSCFCKMLLLIWAYRLSHSTVLENVGYSSTGTHFCIGVFFSFSFFLLALNTTGICF